MTTEEFDEGFQSFQNEKPKKNGTYKRLSDDGSSLLVPSIVYCFYYAMYTVLVLVVPYYFIKNLILLSPWALAYFVWYLYDFPTSERGGRVQTWLRGLSIWRQLARNYPFRLVKTAELPSDRNYIFACHPHGLFAVACCQMFTSDGGRFNELFPGLTSYFISLPVQFFLPLYRDLLLCLGFVSSTSSSIEYLLKKRQGGNVAAIMIGGTREMIDCQPGTMTVIIKRRRGFLRLALKNGASIVPVIAFGENNLYNVVGANAKQLSPLKSFQEWTKDILGFPLVLFYGNFWIFPKRRPVFTVVGSPIHIDEAIKQPTDEQIDQLQEKYINELTKLYDEHKDNYDHSNVELVLK